MFVDYNGVNTISLNDQSLTKPAANDYDVDAWKSVTLAAGESTELRFQAALDKTAQLKGIKINVWDSTALIRITDSYTNVAKWADLKITYKK